MLHNHIVHEKEVNHMTEYKVWIHIEEINEDKDQYQEIEEPQEAGRFSTEQAAHNCAEQLLCRIDTPPIGLHIDPPPKEEDLFRVVYVIDVGATNAHAAAREAYDTMTDPDSLSPVLNVLDPQGHETTFDLSQD